MIPDRSTLPYYSAIQALERFSLEKSPSSNIQVAAYFNYQLKNSFLTESMSQNFAKIPDMDMDSILPLTIYCTILAQNQELLPICKLMLEYLDQEENYEAEKKVFTGLEASLDFIQKDWR